MTLLWPSYACLALAALLTIAEYRDARRWCWILKPAASLAFVTQAFVAGAFDSLYGTLILASLVSSAAGDVLLLPRDKPKVFQLGVGAFSLAHIGYVVALISLGLTQGAGPVGLVAFAIGGGLALASINWLGRQLAKEEMSQIIAYAALIGMMVSFALYFAGGAAAWWVAPAALMFAVSDLAVARDRFITRAPWHAIIITPLYFGAQCLFALSV
ncbi:MAG: lysoplasmalogenase [Parvularculaceae bacterium]|nr:lysoplasmalogenase [Parvularculaceae bacterium]